MIDQIHDPIPPIQLDSLADDVASDYVLQLGTARTTRHASEVNYNSPDPSRTREAVRAIRADITRAVSIAVLERCIEATDESLDCMKEQYWMDASKVGVEHGALAGYELHDYFEIKAGRSYPEIKAGIEVDYTEGSMPRTVLDAIDTYATLLKINPAHAASIVMEIMGRNLHAIKQKADFIMINEGCSASRASAVAVAVVLPEEIEKHITYVGQQFGSGNATVKTAMNKASFYGYRTIEDSDVSLTLSKADADGLVRVCDIQSRPFSKTQLNDGNTIGQQPAMQMAMLKVHNGLIDTFRQYLTEHPERLHHGLENYSEIFVPDYQSAELELLPNPKLLRAMMNNFMPGIAAVLSKKDLSVDAITAEHISDGIKIASGEYKLFQSRIFQFTGYDKEDDTLQLKSTFKSVCPAGALFPNHVSEHLPDLYEKSKQILSTESCNGL